MPRFIVVRKLRGGNPVGKPSVPSIGPLQLHILGPNVMWLPSFTLIA